MNGVTYSWDDNGNLLNDGMQTYTYDQANRLKTVTSQQSPVYSFGHNGVGDRLSQTVGAATTHYVLDPAAGLTQVLSDGTNTYLYGNERLAQYQSAMQYFGPDGLGSVRQIYDASGQVVGNSRYDPYGNVMSQGGATSMFAFAGEQYDAATGMMYLRARYYSAAQGRFTTRDVWEGDPNAPMSYNAWNYTSGNPINLTDPSGKCEDNGDWQCWTVYAQIVYLCPECATTMSWPPGTGDQPLSRANVSYLETVLRDLLTSHSINPDWVELAQRDARLVKEVTPLIKREALQWGVPWQIGAGLFDAEQQLDWKRKNEQRELAYNHPLFNLVLASRGNPAGGIANMHADTARAVAKYFTGYESLTQCLYWQLPISQNEANLVVVNVLRSRENSIRMMMAYIRDLADYRFGSNGAPLKTSHSNLAEWAIADAVAVWHGYRYGVPGVSPEGQGRGFPDLRSFQERRYGLNELINSVIIGDGDAKQSASEAIPIFEKYFRMP